MSDDDPDESGAEPSDELVPDAESHGDAELDPDELSPEEVQDLSTDELVELSEGGVVDAEGNASAFPSGQETTAQDPSAEETAEELVDRLEDISQQSRSTQQEMFTDEWMTDNTDFDSIEAFLEAGPWDVAPEDGLWDVPVAALDEHAAAHSTFDTWEEMSQAAGESWLDDTLDLQDM